MASIEVLEAYDWYESQKEGLGKDFLVEVEKFFKILRSNPKIFSYYEKPVREGKINRFPYTIVYEIIDFTVIIYSVFMAKQNPSKKRVY